MTNPESLRERRKSIRFAISMDARLSCDDGLDAPGTTVNLSSGGALLKTEARVKRGTMVEAHLKWPAGLEACDLKLVLRGPVIWTKGTLIAIRRVKHQFRTVSRRGSRAAGATPAPIPIRRTWVP